MAKDAVQKQYDMTEGSLLAKIVKYAIPLMATGLLQVFYNASDMIIVGQFSPSGSFSMGAVGSCGALINLIINAFIGFSVGSGICVAHKIGAKKYKDVKDLVHTSLGGALICGIAVGIFGFFMCKPLLVLMGTPENTLVEAVPYMKAYFVGIPAMLVYNFMASALRSSGDTKRPFVILAISGLINVALNVVMVICFHMGAIGVGIATSVSQYISAILILVYMIRYNGVCKIRLKDVKIIKKNVADIVRNGLPAGIQSIIFSLSNVLIQSSINAYGDAVVAGNAAAANIDAFVYTAMNSLYVTAMTFTAQNVGAGKIERVKKIAVISVIVVTLTGLLLGGLCMLFNDTLLSIYVHESDPVLQQSIMNTAKLRLEIICTLYFLCGTMEVLSGILRGMGKPIVPMVVSIFGVCVFRVAWILIVCNNIFPGQLVYLYISYPISQIITLTTYLLFCLKTYKSLLAEKNPNGIFSAKKKKQLV